MIGIFLTVFIMPLPAYLLLRLSPVQTFITAKVARSLSEKLGTEVTVGGVDISWFLNISIEDLKIRDRHHKTLIAAHNIKLGYGKIHRNKRLLSLNSISVNKADVNLIQYQGDSLLNLQFIIDYFASTEPADTTTKPWSLRCKTLKIIDSHFNYCNQNTAGKYKGMDYSDIDVSGINLRMKNIALEGDSISGNIRSLTAVEKSGLRIRKFETQALVTSRGFSAQKLHLITDNSDLELDLAFEYPNWNAFNYFLDSVRIVSQIRPSKLDMRDIQFFAPEIEGMNEVFGIAGNLKGTVTSFKGKGMDITYGNSTKYKGDVSLNGLPDWTETFAHFKIENLTTTADDISSFGLPGNTTIGKLPKELYRLGLITVKGRFTGFYNDFVSNGAFWSDAGKLTTDILLTNNKQQQIIEYDGKLSAEDFDLGKILEYKDVGSLSFSANVKGKGLTMATADLTFEGQLQDVEVKGNTLNNIKIDGIFKHEAFSGKVKLADELAKLDFDGVIDLSDSLPSFDFHAIVTDAQLRRLNLVQRDTSTSISTTMRLQFTGNSLDNLIGALDFDNTAFYENGHIIEMNNLQLKTQMLEGDNKKMTLVSDFADATFTGLYTFDDLRDYILLIFTDYLPSITKGLQIKPQVKQGRFDYTIRLKNTRPLTALFLPALELDRQSLLSGSFDPAAGLININAYSPLLRISGLSLWNFTMTGTTSQNKFSLALQSSNVDLSGGIKPDTSGFHIERLMLNALAGNDSVNWQLTWNDQDVVDHNKGNITGSLSFGGFPRLMASIQTAGILINDSSWAIQQGNSVLIDSGYIALNNLKFSNNQQSLSINGAISHDPLDKLSLNLQNFDLSALDILTKEIGIDFDGLANGDVSLSEVYNIPKAIIQLQIKNFGFNHEQLGDFEAFSAWNTGNKSLDIDGCIAYHGSAGLHYPLLVNGSIYPQRKHNNFDIDLTADNLKVKLFEPFFTGLFSKLKGYGTGKIKLKGDFADPVLAGSVHLMRTQLMVDYTKTSYSFAGDLNFDKDVMWFKDISINDSLGNTGLANGKINHHAFSDWSFDINLKADKMAALNTVYSPLEYFYGKAIGSGDISITGPVNDILMKINAKTEKGTDIHVPISYSVSISDNNYIRYINTETEDSITVEDAIPEFSNLDLQMQIQATRDAALEIILPYQMGNIKVRGDGNVNMGVDSKGNYTMHGQYHMDEGNFLFSLQNIFSRNFQIERGGIITFNGSPYDADINLRAVYKVKPDLKGLIASVGDAISGKRVPIDCIISLRNSLYNPDLRFSIEMPDADPETQRIIYSVIDTSNQVAMNQQMISLLVLNSFSFNQGTTALSSSLGSSSFDMLSSQLSSMLSQISKDFDIGVNYRPGDQVTAQQLELALSTQLFDDRVTIEGSMGMNSGAGAASTATQASNKWVGDVNVEVKLTDDGRFRVKAYNRANNSLDLNAGRAPYTQGVGVIFRKEFDQLTELFRKRKMPVY